MFIISLLQFTVFNLIDSILYYFIKEETTRYFIFHIIFNLYIILLTFNTFIDCLLQPMNIFDNKYNTYSILSTISIMNFHIYHIITSVKELSTETMIHHTIGAIINPLITINQPIGKLPAIHNIILCGIPGFIDYFLLTLVKFKIIKKINEKKINRYLNLLIRWPFIFLSDYLYALNIYNNKISFNIYTIIPMIINNYNSIYFCDKIIGNYYIYNENVV